MGAVMITPRAGRIPFAAIDGYARRFGIDGAGFDLLIDLVGKLDAEFMKWEAEKARERTS